MAGPMAQGAGLKGERYLEEASSPYPLPPFATQFGLPRSERKPMMATSTADEEKQKLMAEEVKADGKGDKKDGTR